MESVGVSHIVHISDIHIRAGDRSKSRFDEYSSAFEALCADLSRLDFIRVGSAVIVITGDVFHNKSSITAYGLVLFRKLLDGLRALGCKVLLIRGNHDVVQSNSTPEPEQDLIRACLDFAEPEGVEYVARTGVVSYRNVTFGVLDIMDVLLPGSGSGHVQVMPAMPSPPASSSPGHWNIALYHGPVEQSAFIFGNAMLQTDHFSEYDLLLCGDIHDMQICGKKARETISFDTSKRPMCWGYSGSLIQQNHGEPLHPHGYLIWDLARRRVTPVHVRNAYGFVTAASTYSEEEAWFPNKIRLRKPVGKLVEKLPANSEVIECNDFYAAGANASGNRKVTAVNPLRSRLSNSVDAWVDFLARRLEKSEACDTVPWRDWLKRPEEALALDLACVPEQFQAVAGERNRKLAKMCAQRGGGGDDAPAACCSAIDLLCLEWQWLLCYGPCNRVDFRCFGDQKIVLLNARNGMGKSSFLDIVCLSLFGKDVPTRKATSASALVNNAIPEKQRASACVEFTLNGGPVCKITRDFGAAGNTAKVFVDGALVKQGKTAVADWVASNVGSLDAFLTGMSMLTQKNDRDFFSLKLTDQMAVISDSLKIESSIRSVCELMDEATLACNALLAAVKTHVAPSEANLENCRKQAEALKDKRVELSDVQSDLNCALEAYGGVSTSLILDPAVKAELARGCSKQALTAELEEVSTTNDIDEYDTEENLARAEREFQVRLAELNQEQMDIMRDLSDLRIHAPPRETGVEETACDYDELLKIENLWRLSAHQLQRAVPPKHSFVLDPPVQKPEGAEVWLSGDDSLASVEEALRDLRALEKEREAIEAKVRRNATWISEDSDAPFNPDCWACREQPRRKMAEQLQLENDVMHVTLAEIDAKIVRASRGVSVSTLRDVQAWLSYEKYQLQQNELVDAQREYDNYLRGFSSRWMYLERSARERLAAAKTEIEQLTVKSRQSKLRFQAACRRSILMKTLEVHDEWRRRADARDRVSVLKTKLQALTKDVANLERFEAEETTEKERLHTLATFQQRLRDRKAALAEICEHLRGYCNWVYEHELRSVLEDEVNQLLACFGCDFHVSISWTADKRAYEWAILEDGGRRKYALSKCGGFTYFIVGMGMRMALASLSSTAVVRCKQLFLDEAFVWCDSENLSRVPSFLKGLMHSSNEYSLIFLVTHLEDIKDCADVVLEICRDKLHSKLYVA